MTTPPDTDLCDLIGRSLLGDLCDNFRQATGWRLDARDAQGQSLLGLIPKGTPPVHEVPLSARQGRLGTLVLEAPAVDGPPADFLAARALAESVGRVVSRLAGCRLAGDRLRQDLSTASKIQARLLPTQAIDHERYELAAWSQASHEVGGDLYDLIPIVEDNLGIAVGDASGKSVSAALLMVAIHAGLRAHVGSVFRVSDILDRLNQALCRSTQGEWFVTLFYGVLDARRRRLSYANAGHNAPLLWREGRWQALREGGVMLGVEPGVRYGEAAAPLLPGDLVVFYTDGITEAMSPQEELFGVDRLKGVVAEGAPESAAAVLGGLRSAVLNFAGSVPRDDLTAIVLKMK